ncbi:MAG TPA: prepilin-type N-terminal cleavage/methylation domain-containing protein [Pyrinomonadaceae bacterium]
MLHHRQTTRRGGRQTGFSLIELLIVVAIIGIVAAIAIPNLLASRRAANEASAISSMRTIGSAQVTYRGSIGQGAFTTLSVLAADKIIDPALGAATSATNTRNGYFFTVTVAPDAYFSGAAAAPGAGTRRFSSTQDGVIYADPSTPTVMLSAIAGVPIGN